MNTQDLQLFKEKYITKLMFVRDKNKAKSEMYLEKSKEYKKHSLQYRYYIEMSETYESFYKEIESIINTD